MEQAKRYRLRKDRARELSSLVKERLPELADLLSRDLEVWETRSGKLILSSGRPILILSGPDPVPVLPIAESVVRPRAIVDMGAVAPICRGADIMGRGVKSATEFSAGDLVLVLDERHAKPLAVGKALVPSAEAVGRSGKVIQNLHHVGDDFWEMMKSVHPSMLKSSKMNGER